VIAQPSDDLFDDLAEENPEALLDDGLSEDEAVEYLSYNTLGAYVGPDGPLFVRTKDGP